MLKMLYNLEKEQVKEIIKSPKIGENIFTRWGLTQMCCNHWEGGVFFTKKLGVQLHQATQHPPAPPPIHDAINTFWSPPLIYFQLQKRIKGQLYFWMVVFLFCFVALDSLLFLIMNNKSDS